MFSLGNREYWFANEFRADVDPVVQMPINVKPRVKFNPGFFSFCSKAFSRIIFSVILQNAKQSAFFLKISKKKVKCGARVVRARNTDCFAVQIFLRSLIINLLKKAIKLNLLFKLSYLNSNFALNLGYFNSYFQLYTLVGGVRVEIPLISKDS